MGTNLFRFALPFVLVGCVQGPSPRPEEPGPVPSPPAPKKPRTAVDRCPTPRPDWLEKGSFTDPLLRGVVCFVGTASNQRGLEQAMAAAEAAARNQAGAYMGVRVKSTLEREFKAKLVQGRAVVEEAIRDAASQVVDGWLERALRTESWWERFDDGTWDASVLMQVPEQSLNPLTALSRRLRLEAMRAEDPKDRLACCEGILALHLADRHAHYLKAQLLEALGRPGDARETYERLRSLNQGPLLDLAAVYTEVGIEPPAGGVKSIDLDEELFRLTPHWENAVKRLEALAREKASPASLVLTLNRTRFRVAEHEPGSRPVLVNVDFPGGTRRPVALLWIDQASLCQANPAAPDVELPRQPWLFPLAEKNGEVLLIALAGTEDFAIAEFDLAFEKGIERESVVRLDKGAVNRLEGVLRRLEELAKKGQIVATALVRFDQG